MRFSATIPYHLSVPSRSHRQERQGRLGSSYSIQTSESAGLKMYPHQEPGQLSRRILFNAIDINIHRQSKTQNNRIPSLSHLRVQRNGIYQSPENRTQPKPSPIQTATANHIQPSHLKSGPKPISPILSFLLAQQYLQPGFAPARPDQLQRHLQVRNLPPQ